MSRTTRIRLLVAGALFAGLWLLQIVLGAAFPVVVSVALIAGPIVNWRAFFKLRAQERASQASSSSIIPIISLRTAKNTALLLAVASTGLASFGVFVVVRAIAPTIPPLTREQVLVLLTWPIFLLSGPAIEWLRFRVG